MLKQEDTAEPQNNASVPQLDEHVDTKDGEINIDFELDVNYGSGRPDLNNKPDHQEEK